MNAWSRNAHGIPMDDLGEGSGDFRDRAGDPLLRGRALARRARATSLILLSALPAVFLVAMIERYGVDVPYMDQWDMVPTMQLAFEYEGGPRLVDLRSQHCEHRPLFPRIVMVAMGRLTRWNLIWEMRLNVALAGGMLLVLGSYSGALRTIAGRPPPIVPCYSLLVFSLVQYQNWLMGPTFFLNALSAVVALVFLSSSGLAVGALSGAVVAGVISSYSMGNGLLVWPLGAALIAFAPGATKARRVGAATIWLSVASLVILSYFDNFHLEGHHSTGLRLPLRHVIEDPAAYGGFVLTFLGAPLTSEHVRFAGLLGLLIAVWGIVGLRASKDGRMAIRRLSPFLAIGVYSLGSASLAAYGRIAGGPEGALQSRYATMSIPFWLMNLSILWAAMQTGQAQPRVSRVLRNLLSGLVVVAIAGSAACGSAKSIEHFRRRHHVLMNVREGLLDGTASDALLQRVFPNPAMVREYSEILKRNGLSLFRGLVTDDWQPPPRLRRERRVRP